MNVKEKMGLPFKDYPPGINYNFLKRSIAKENCCEEFANFLVRTIMHSHCFYIFILARARKIFSLKNERFLEGNTEKIAKKLKNPFLE